MMAEQWKGGAPPVGLMRQGGEWLAGPPQKRTTDPHPEASWCAGSEPCSSQEKHICPQDPLWATLRAQGQATASQRCPHARTSDPQLGPCLCPRSVASGRLLCSHIFSSVPVSGAWIPLLANSLERPGPRPRDPGEARDHGGPFTGSAIHASPLATFLATHSCIISRCGLPLYVLSTHLSSGTVCVPPLPVVGSPLNAR